MCPLRTTRTTCLPDGFGSHDDALIVARGTKQETALDRNRSTATWVYKCPSAVGANQSDLVSGWQGDPTGMENCKAGTHTPHVQWESFRFEHTVQWSNGGFSSYAR